MKTQKASLLFIFLFITLSITSLAQWSPNPSTNTPIATESGEQSLPQIISSSSYPGISYVSWISNENGGSTLRLQKLGVDGAKLWENGGIIIREINSNYSTIVYEILIDADDCVIIAVQDNETMGGGLFAYKISPDGATMWGNEGILLSVNISTNPYFDIAISNLGKTIVTWVVENAIYMQKISPGGDLLWGDSGNTIFGTENISYPQIVSLRDDNILIKYFEDNSTNLTQSIYIQRFIGNGDKVWSQVTKVSDINNISAQVGKIPFINDGNDGCYIAWNDYTDKSLNTRLFVQHVNSSGQKLYPINGIEASLYKNTNQTNPQLLLHSESNDIFVFWDENDNNKNSGVFGQKISPTGKIHWGDTGKNYYKSAKSKIHTIATKASGEDLLIFFNESPDIEIIDIKAIKIDVNGLPVWPSNCVTVSNANSKKHNEFVSNLNFGQWIVLWEDDRDKTSKIYGQNIKLDGTLGSISTLFKADFKASSEIIKKGEEIQFTDLTPGKVISWKWRFEGGIPEISFDQNQSVIYKVSGNYDVELIVSDGVVSDTTLRQEYISVDELPARKASSVTHVRIKKEVAEKKSTKEYKPKYNYYIVIGCFAEKNGADKFINKIKNQGIVTSIIGTSKNGMFRVGLGAGNENNKALQKLTAIRQNDFPDAWLLKK